MITRKIIERTEEWNDNGNLIRRIVIETTEEDGNTNYPYTPKPLTPDAPYNPIQPYYFNTGPYCNCSSDTNKGGVQ